MTHDEVVELFKMEDKIKNEMLSRSTIVKVAHEVVEETDQDISGGKAFIKQQAKALIIHNEKLKALAAKKKRTYDQHVWITTKGRGEGVNTDSLNIKESVPLPLQDPSIPKPSQRKRKSMTLEHETFIVGHHCNMKVPKGVKFKENKDIEAPESDKHILLTKKAKLEPMGFKEE
nr:Toll/interleukin-1 receptor (TIR) domain-containing protein [Tanacetum cinerariifolium]